MRVVVQRSKKSSVIINGKVNGKIDKKSLPPIVINVQ